MAPNNEPGGDERKNAFTSPADYGSPSSQARKHGYAALEPGYRIPADHVPLPTDQSGKTNKMTNPFRAAGKMTSTD